MARVNSVFVGAGDIAPASGDLRAKRQRIAYPDPTGLRTAMPLLTADQYDAVFQGRDGGYNASMGDETAIGISTINLFPVPRINGDHQKFGVEGTWLFVVLPGFPGNLRAYTEDDSYKNVKHNISQQDTAGQNGFSNVTSIAELNRYIREVLATFTPPEYTAKTDRFADVTSLDYVEMDHRRHMATREICKYVRFHTIVGATGLDALGQRQGFAAVNVPGIVQGMAKTPIAFKYLGDPDAAGAYKRTIPNRGTRNTVEIEEYGVFNFFRPTDPEYVSSRLRIGDHIVAYLDDADHQWYGGFTHVPIHGWNGRRKMDPTLGNDFKRHVYHVGKVITLTERCICMNPDVFATTELVDRGNHVGQLVQITMLNP